MARHLVDQGALMLFVPFCTDERRGYLRVRYCCQARAVENQCYVTMSGVVGNLPNVEEMDIHYAESAILTPSDFPLPATGSPPTPRPTPRPSRLPMFRSPTCSKAVSRARCKI
jgi:predicted amidohydrolase